MHGRIDTFNRETIGAVREQNPSTPLKTAIPNEANLNTLKDSTEILFQLFLPDRKNHQKPTQAPLGPACRNQTTQIKRQLLFI